MIYTVQSEDGEEYICHSHGGVPPDKEKLCRILSIAFEDAFGDLPAGENPWDRKAGTEKKNMARDISAYDDKSQLAILFCHDTSEVPWPKNAPRLGQRLYYKDKLTGEIKSGEVIKEGRFKFNFLFDNNKVVRLDVSVVGRRLFQFEFDAANYGLTVGNNVRREH